jgi:hypothetical protein
LGCVVRVSVCFPQSLQSKFVRAMPPCFLRLDVRCRPFDIASAAVFWCLGCIQGLGARLGAAEGPTERGVLPHAPASKVTVATPHTGHRKCGGQRLCRGREGRPPDNADGRFPFWRPGEGRFGLLLIADSFRRTRPGLLPYLFDPFHPPELPETLGNAACHHLAYAVQMIRPSRWVAFPLPAKGPQDPSKSALEAD